MGRKVYIHKVEQNSFNRLTVFIINMLKIACSNSESKDNSTVDPCHFDTKPILLERLISTFQET